MHTVKREWQVPISEIMASSSIATKKLEDQLTCPICLDEYDDPRTLQCLHSFCTKCLQRLPLVNKKSISCPTCRTAVDIPQQGVATFPKAFHLNNLIEVQNLLKRASGDNKSACDNCTNKEAELYCAECDKFICPPCNEVHKKWSSLSAHQIISVSEVSSKASQMVSVKPVPIMNCPSHCKTLDLYCVTCEQPICYHCTIKDHKKHTHDLISDAYQENKSAIQNRAESLKGKIDEKNEAEKSLQQNKQDAQNKGAALKVSINEICDHFIKKIENVRAVGLRYVDTGVLLYNKVEDQQIKELHEELKALHNCNDHVEKTLQMSTPSQLLATKKQTMSRIDQLIGPSVEQKSKKATKVQCPSNRFSYIQSDSESDDDEPALNQYYSMHKNEHWKKGLEKKVEDHQTVDELKNEIFSIVPFKYPEYAYKQCKFVSANFPKRVTIDDHESAKFSFSLQFQGQPMLVKKEDITCSLRSNNYRRGHNIPCPVESYIIEGDEVKYNASFTAGNANGTYSLVLQVCEVELMDVQQELTIEEMKTRLVPVLPARGNRRLYFN